MMIKTIIHTADLHIKCNVQTSEEFVKYNKFADSITSNINSPSETVIIIAGDVLDRFNCNTNATLTCCFNVLKKLSEACYKVFVMPGNHDIARDGSCILKVICESIDGVEYCTAGSVVVHNISLTFLSPDAEDDIGPLESFPKSNLSTNEFGVYHGMVECFLGNSSIKPSRIAKRKSWFEGLGYKAVFLGDIHQAIDFTCGDGTKLIYSGTPYTTSVQDACNYSVVKWDVTTSSFERIPLDQVEGPVKAICSSLAPIRQKIKILKNIPKPEFLENTRKLEVEYNKLTGKTLNLTTGVGKIKAIPHVSKVWGQDVFGYETLPPIKIDVSNIVRLGGANGSGKTNLINVIYLSLYGLPDTQTLDLPEVCMRSGMPCIDSSVRLTKKLAYQILSDPGKSIPKDQCIVAALFNLNGVEYGTVVRITPGTKRRDVYTCFIYNMDSGENIEDVDKFHEGFISYDIYKQLTTLSDSCKLFSDLTEVELLAIIRGVFIEDDESVDIMLSLELNGIKEARAGCKAVLDITIKKWGLREDDIENWKPSASPVKIIENKELEDAAYIIKQSQEALKKTRLIMAKCKEEWQAAHNALDKIDLTPPRDPHNPVKKWAVDAVEDFGRDNIGKIRKYSGKSNFIQYVMSCIKNSLKEPVDSNDKAPTPDVFMLRMELVGLHTQQIAEKSNKLMELRAEIDKIMVCMEREDEVNEYLNNKMNSVHEYNRQKNLGEAIELVRMKRKELAVIETKLKQFTNFISMYHQRAEMIYPIIVDIVSDMLSNYGLPSKVSVDTVTCKRTQCKALTIKLIRGKGTVNSNRASGYQRLMIDLAIRAAIPVIHTVITGSESYKCSHLIIDEALHRIDANNAANIDDYMNHLLDMYSTVFLVSHDKSLNVKSDRELFATGNTIEEV